MHTITSHLSTVLFVVASAFGLLFALAFFRYDLKKLGIPLALLILALGYIEFSSLQIQKYEAGRYVKLVAYCKAQHANFLMRYAYLHKLKAVPTYDFELLANVIDRHENSTKFRYGCEYRGDDGKIHGYTPEKARAKCIALCQKIYNKWVASGCQGSYFVLLNHTYAKDPIWHVDVANKYAKAMSKQGQLEIATR